MTFRTNLGQNVFAQKYAQGDGDTWSMLAFRVVDAVCGTAGGTTHPLLSKSELDQLTQYIDQKKFIPGGRYLYYAGREMKAYNNCYLLRGEEDTREEWANVVHRAMSCLSVGGGIGVDYSVFRPEGARLRRTGGKASGPIPLAWAVNEIGRQVMQGGSRRSAIYASLNWQHRDIGKFLTIKNWDEIQVGSSGLTYSDMKEQDFNFPAPLDMTNISLNWDDDWLNEKSRSQNPIFLQNVRQAMRNGEPGFSFNFGDQANETLRNACTEVTSEDDSDVCTLGSLNMAEIETLEEMASVTALA